MVVLRNLCGETIALSTSRGENARVEDDRECKTISWRKRVKRAILCLLLLPLCPTVHARDKIEGAWELTCITPTDSIENTDPAGAINSKFVFDSTGHLQTLEPDQATASPDTISTYSMNDGDVEIIFPDGSRRYLRNVQFPTRQTMILPRAGGGGYSLFRRIPSASTLLEPRSLQRVSEGDVKRGHECEDTTKYDRRDYASLPLHDRLQGTWEIVMYRHISPHGLPPYGYANDLFIISADTLTIHSALNGKDREVPYALTGGMVRTGDVAMTPSFNQWSQLILTNDDGGQIYLKRLSRNTEKPYPELVLKIVWTGIEEAHSEGKDDNS